MTCSCQARQRSLTAGSGVGGVGEGPQGRGLLTDDHKRDTGEIPSQ